MYYCYFDYFQKKYIRRRICDSILLFFRLIHFRKNPPDTHLCTSKVKYVAIDRRKCAIFSYLFRRIVPHRSIWLRQIYSLNTYGVKSPKFILAPCAQLYSLANTLNSPFLFSFMELLQEAPSSLLIVNKALVLRQKYLFIKRIKVLKFFS